MSTYTNFVQIGDAINKSLEIIENEQVGYYAIPSGYPTLDGLTHKWEPGELIVIGGDPGVGKSIFALNLVRNALVDNNIASAYFSLEMSVTSLTRRLIAMESGMSMQKLAGYETMENEDWAQIETRLKTLSKAPLFIDDTCSMSIEQFRERVKILVNSENVNFVIIDYLSLISSDNPLSSFNFRRLECQNNLRILKEIAFSLNIVIIALTHIEWRRRKLGCGPSISDLKSYYPLVEEFADKIILLHRLSFYTNASFEGNNMDTLEVRLVKNAKGGTGIVKLYLDRDTLKLSDS